MEIGIFARTFFRPTLEETLDAVVGHDLRCIQFNFALCGGESMPATIEPRLTRRVRRATTDRDISIAAVSGTFNMIHPDASRRTDGLRRLHVLASACADIGTVIITLCTGTRDPGDMWSAHPDNQSDEAWRDLLTSMAQAVAIAEETGVNLAFEPEVSSVVDTVEKGRRLLDAIRSPHLKVVMDPANLFHRGQIGAMPDVLDRAFDLLGHDIVIAHAKDLSQDGEAGHEAAGEGLLDYDRYLRLLCGVRFDGPLILHSLTETQVDGCVAFLREKLVVQAERAR